MIWNRPLAHSVAWAAGSVVLAAAIVGVHTVPAAAQQARVFDVLCTPTDAGLSELSGLTVTAAGMYAIGDSGSDDRVAELDSNCHVQRWISVGTPRVDVEDLSSTPDGHLWLADIGDNNAVRTSIGLIELDPTSGAATSYPPGLSGRGARCRDTADPEQRASRHRHQGLPGRKRGLHNR